jgi:hypothetical protein
MVHNTSYSVAIHENRMTLMTPSRETRRLPTALIFAALLAAWAGPRVQAGDSIWIEGESPQSQTMTRHPWWYEYHGMLDCFAFTSGFFMPEGKRKPGEKSDASEVAAEGRWPFQPPRDAFSPQALLDLRSLNEKLAGEHGFVTRSKDGNDFAFADGMPVRFWAVNDGAFDKDLPRHARFLAKRGINRVRFHSNIAVQRLGHRARRPLH